MLPIRQGRETFFYWSTLQDCSCTYPWLSVAQKLEKLEFGHLFTSMKICGSESMWCFQMQFTERDSAGVAQARGAKGGEDLSPESSSKAAFLSPSRRVDFCPVALYHANVSIQKASLRGDWFCFSVVENG